MKQVTPVGIVGQSRCMQQLLDTIRKAANREETVLILGETGTGKELVAEALHFFGKRADRLFHAVSAPEVSDTLAASVLFGHEKGAFTGASDRTLGVFSAVCNGTVYIDEIGDASRALQAMLLRVLETRQFYRVGGTQLLSFDARVVMATHADLELEMQEGRFREDFYYRICGIPIHVPPLRARREDIPCLVEQFLRSVDAAPGTSFSPEAMVCLQDQHWPGNVRQLRRVVEQAAVFATGQRIEVDDLLNYTILRSKLAKAGPRGRAVEDQLSPEAGLRSTMARFLGEGGREDPMQALSDLGLDVAKELARGNVGELASFLGKPTRTVYAMLERAAARSRAK